MGPQGRSENSGEGGMYNYHCVESGSNETTTEVFPVRQVTINPSHPEFKL
jgi:hypothetical protein